MPKHRSKLEKEELQEATSTFQLNNEQIQAQQELLQNDITILIGHAGSGKTALACHTALRLFDKGKIGKIIITRPTIGTEDIGFLPGGLEDKYTPFVMPIITNMKKMMNPKRIDMMIKNKQIEMLPLQYVRGITYERTAVIIDEAQNLTIPQLKMCMTRIGTDSKIFICGDTDQIDLRKSTDSGLIRVSRFEINGLACITLTSEHRKQIVVDLLKAFATI